MDRGATGTIHYRLVGVFRPRRTGAGFGIPVFVGDDRVLCVQRLGEDGLVSMFVPCEIERTHLKESPSIPSVKISIGKVPIMAFESISGDIWVGTRDELMPRLLSSIEDYLEMPFILHDVALCVNSEKWIEVALGRIRSVLARENSRAIEQSTVASVSRATERTNHPRRARSSRFPIPRDTAVAGLQRREILTSMILQEPRFRMLIRASEAKAVGFEEGDLLQEFAAYFLERITEISENNFHRTGRDASYIGVVFKTWLLRKIRTRTREVTRLALLLSKEEETQHVPKSSHHRLVEALWTCIDQLHQGPRTLMTQLLEGKKVREIARERGQNLSSTYRRYYAILGVLRRCLNEKGIDIGDLNDDLP